MKMKSPATPKSNEGWIRQLCEPVCRIVGGWFANQAVCAKGYGIEARPVLKLGRVNGKLVPMGRNAIMKMLIEKHGTLARNSRIGLHSIPNRRADVQLS
jgi:hypothetical protein